jgi:hypothetical protein
VLGEARQASPDELRQPAGKRLDAPVLAPDHEGRREDVAVEYTQDQLAGFKTEFAKRQRRQLAVAAVIFCGAIAVMILRDRSAFETPVGPALIIAAMAAILVFTFQNWRCPACQRYLGKAGFPRFCPRCGVPLK